MTEALDRLREAARATKPPPTPFVGAGLSSAATDGAAHASWRGLLLDGIEVCERVVSPLPAGWASFMNAQLDNADVTTYLTVADEITRRLRAVRGGREFDAWIRTTVGALHPTAEGERIIKAVRSLGPVIMTTNYDTLLEDVEPPWSSTTWMDPDAGEAVRGTEVVLHLHGVARDPESIILSSADYVGLGKEELPQVLNRSFFASHRFIFIGCGDGLSDPNIAPLIEFVNRVMPKKKTEHYILVRGGQLRELIENPFSELIVPVAYGTSFGELPSFLEKLAAGKDIEVSQDPRFYEQRTAAKPRTALLELAGPAQQKLQDALDALQRAMHAMGQVEHRGAMPAGMAGWDLGDQAAVHAQLAASVTDPAAYLESCLLQVVLAFEDAGDDVGQLMAPKFAKHADRLAPIIETVSELADQSELLLGRATRARDDLGDRTEVCADYRIPFETLRRAHERIAQAKSTAISLREGLDRLRPVQATEPARAARSASQGPELRIFRPEPGGTAAPVFGLVQVKGKVSGGPGILPTGEDPEYLPLLPELAHRDDAFAVKVKGNSMSGDGVLDGDYVIAVPDPDPKDGEIVVVYVGGEEGEAVVKRLRREGDAIRLESSNPDAESRPLDEKDQPEIQGRVIAVQRWYGLRGRRRRP
jgi:SOS-response transcriptional repressor LexA